MEQIRKVRYDDDGHGRKIEVVISIGEPTQSDQAEFDALGLKIDLSDRVRISAHNNDRYKGGYAKTFMEREVFDRLGVDYIVEHATLEESVHIGHIVTISQNDYYNDLKRNPERVIPIRYVGQEDGTWRELYQDDDGNRYAREVYYPRENCAKWYCYGKDRNASDGWHPRPNTIFEHNGQREKVTYDDWNNVMAYSETFNKDFRGEV